MTDYKVPAGLRFLMELTSWVWLFLVDWLYALVSVLSLALLNVRGDKKTFSDPVLGIAVPGPVRLFFELGTAVLGLINAFYLTGLLGGLLQLTIIALYLRFDYERLLWFAGIRSSPPEYIEMLHKLNAKNK